MIAWMVGVALAGGAPTAPAETIDAPTIPGVALASAGLATGGAGVAASAVGFPLFTVRAPPVSEPASVAGGNLAFAGVAASLTGPVLISVGQKRALDPLDARGVQLPRAAKRVGDGLFVGGAATLGLSTALLYANSDNTLPIAGMLAGGASMALSLIPYGVQQGVIVRGARQVRTVSLAATPAGVAGRF